MRFSRLLLAALSGAILATSAPAQTETDSSSLLAKAQHGNAIAQYNLGLAYMQGSGVAADPVEAFVWLSLAQENGARGQALNGVVGSLSAGQLAEARQRLAERRRLRGILAPPVQTAAPAAQTPPPAPAQTETPTVAAPTGRPAPGAETSPRHEQANDATDREQLSRELALAWNENEQLKTKLGLAESASGEAARLRAEHDNLTNRINSLGTELTVLRTDRDNARSFGQQVEETLNKVNDQKAALEAQLRTSQERLQAASAQAAATAAQLAQARAIAAQGSPDTSALKELQAKYANLSALAETARQETEKQAHVKKDLEQRLTGLTNQLTTAQQQATALDQAR